MYFTHLTTFIDLIPPTLGLQAEIVRAFVALCWLRVMPALSTVGYTRHQVCVWLVTPDLSTCLEYIDGGSDAHAEAEWAPCCMSQLQI